MTALANIMSKCSNKNIGKEKYSNFGHIREV